MSVAGHYNKNRQRKDDFMLPVRNAHNFAKACLIKESAPERALDFCCGNGGDVMKFKLSGCREYIGVDIAADAVARAEDRLERINGMKSEVLVMDCFGDDMLQLCTQVRKFNVVSCQFAIHYAFQSERSCYAAFRNISTALRPGGILIGTTLDGDKIDMRRQRLGLKFGDRYFKVCLASRDAADFGDAYVFSFTGAVEALEEYVTRRTVFERVADSCGLDLVRWESLSTYVERKREEDMLMWQRMNGPDALVDVSTLYVVFECRKRDNS